MQFLIVDDESWVRTTLKTLIHRKYSENTKVFEATNGLHALALIESNDQSMILIIDMKMPGMDGRTLLEEMIKRKIDVPIIVLSGYDDFIYTKQAIQSRVIEYLLKPINQIELYASIEKALEYQQEMKSRYYKLSLLPDIDNESLNDKIQKLYKEIYYTIKNSDEKQLEKAMRKLLLIFKNSSKRNTSLLVLLERKFVEIIEKLIQDFGLSLEEMDIHKEYFTIQLSESFEQVLNKQLKIGKKIIAYLTENKKKTNKVPLQEVKLYIENNFTSDTISLEEVAGVFFVSKEYLTTVFKKEFGYNVTEYIILLRMQEAKELILTTDLQYKIVAERVGYAEVSYFYRVFKKFYKKSPGEMRKK